MALQVWLPLNGDTTQQGVSGITMTGSPNSWVDGKIGKCARFAGNVSNRINNNTTDFNYTDNFSWTIWVNTNYTGSTAQYIFTNGRADTGGYGYGLQCTATTTCHARYGNTSYGIPVTSGEWTHLAFTKKGTEIKIYKNGVVYSTNTFGGTAPTYSDGDGLGIGCFHYNGGSIYPYYGDINDFRIYDHALSAREVKELSKGLVLHYPLSRGGFGQDNLIAGSAQQRDCTYPESGVSDFYGPITVSVPSGTQYTLSFYAKSTVDGDHMRTHYYSPNTTTTCVSSQGVTKSANDGNMDFTLSTEWKRYWVVYTQTETTAVKHIICPRLCSMAGYPSASGTGTVSVKYVKFEEGSVPTPWLPNSSETLYSSLGLNDGIEYDVSGYCNNGTITNGSLIDYSSDSMRYNVSTVFKRLSSDSNSTSVPWIQCNNFYMPDVFTIAFWWYFDSTYNLNTNNCPSLFGYGTSSGHDTNGLHSYDNKFVGNFAVMGSDTKSEQKYVALPSCTNGTWNHICVTFDGNVMKAYKNGALSYTTTVNSSEKMHLVRSTSTLYVGFDQAGGIYRGASGKLSDFRIYATVLSADDILELYNTPITLSQNGVLLTQGEYQEV